MNFAYVQIKGIFTARMYCNRWKVSKEMFVILMLVVSSNISLHFNNYRPQRSWGKVMFLQASMILLTGGVCLSACWDIPPRSRHPHPRADSPPPQEQTPPPQSRLPPQEQTPPPQHRACWEIRSTRGRYASYWNAILLTKFFHPVPVGFVGTVQLVATAAADLEVVVENLLLAVAVVASVESFAESLVPEIDKSVSF